MITGEHGPLTPEEVDKFEADKKESARVRSLSDKNLAGEIRSKIKSNTNMLAFAIGTVLLGDA